MKFLKWNFANVEVETNSQGHKHRFKKSKQHLCIDGAVAAAMAVARAAAAEDQRSIYTDATARPEGLLFF